MRFDVISVFPSLIEGFASYGVCGRAVERGQVELKAWDLRDFTHDKHRSVDDRPFGGGPGMLMRPEPLLDALASAREAAVGTLRCVYLSPQGQPLNQSKVAELLAFDRLILLAGRYEGVDERVIDHAVDEELSIGDYVLSGGELPALVLMDAMIRQLPGVLGSDLSAAQDSFFDGLLDCPHYTRPASLPQRLLADGLPEAAVPDVLLSGDHRWIARWRLKQALGRTWLRRPDLLQQRDLTPLEHELLEEFRDECCGA